MLKEKITGGNANENREAPEPLTPRTEPISENKYSDLQKQFKKETQLELENLYKQVSLKDWEDFQAEREPKRVFPPEYFFRRGKANINFEKLEKFAKENWTQPHMENWVKTILEQVEPNYGEACMQTWTQPPGILHSCQTTALKYKMHIKNGLHWFPEDFEGPLDPRCVFKRKKLDTPFLINPPYEANLVTPILQHLQQLAGNNQQSLVVVLPKRIHTGWFKKYALHQHNTFIELRNELIFLHNARGICGAFQEKIILLFINVIGKPIKVDNDAAGNFSLTLQDIVSWTWRFTHRINLQDHVFQQFVDKNMSNIKILTEIRKQKFTPKDLGIKLKALRKLPENRRDENFHPEELLRTHQVPKYFKERLVDFNKTRNTIFETISQTKERLSKQMESIVETCTLCQSGKHSEKACLLAKYDGSHLQNEDEKSVLKFLQTLESRNGLAQLRNGRKPFRTRQEKDTFSTYLYRWQENARMRATEFQTALEKEANWTIKPDYQFSLIRWKLRFWYGYGVPKNHLLKLFGGWRIIPSCQIGSRIITKSDFPTGEVQLRQLDETIEKRVLQGRLIPIHQNLVHGGCTEFPVEQNEKVRPITDASGINPLYRPDPIIYPTIKEVLTNFHKKIVVAIDLSKAYHQMPIAWTDLQNFCIKHREKWYLQTGMPQGFSRAPEMFTHFLKPVQKILEKLGLDTAVLIDDIFLAISNPENSEEEVRRRIQIIINFFEDLGLIMNEKTQVFAQAEATYLGKQVNTALGKEFATEKKIKQFQERQKSLFQNPTKKDAAGFCGLTEFLIPGASVYTRDIQKALYEDFSLGKNPTKKTYQKFYKSTYHLTGGCIDDIGETIKKLFNLQKEVEYKRIDKRAILVHSDASDESVGYFITCPSKSKNYILGGNNDQNIFKSELFSDENNYLYTENITSSTYRETLGVLKALQFLHIAQKPGSFTKVEIFTDNLALAIIGSRRKSKHPPTQNLLTKIGRFNRWDVEFHWHRRSRPKAAVADYLSKVSYFRPKQPLRDLVKKYWKIEINNTIYNSKWVKTTWKMSPVGEKLRNLLNNETTLIVVPLDVLNKNLNTFYEFLMMNNYQGMTLSPNCGRTQSTQILANMRLKNIHIAHNNSFYYYDKNDKKLPRIIYQWS